MLAVLFSLGAERFGLAASAIDRVVPALPLQATPGLPTAVAGTFSYRGQLVPVIDLVQFRLGRPAESFLSSRIMLVKRTDALGRAQLLGLLAERVNEVRDLSANSADGVQLVTLEQLLSPELLAQINSLEVASVTP